METRIFLNKKIILLVLVSLLSGCSHAPKRPENNPAPIAMGPNPPTYGPDQPFGPEAPPQGPVFGPEFKAERPVVLVLGPGMARGYAYSGVIRALSDAKIKIGAIYGTEMGALMGSLYALTGSVNKMEWGVQRFRDDVFETDEGLLSKIVSQNRFEKLDSALERVFNNRDLVETKIPVRIVLGAVVNEHGPLRTLLHEAMAGKNHVTRPFDIQDAKALGLGPVIAVDVLDPKESDLFPELKEADLILRPDTEKISKTDFKKRTDAVFAGKAVTRDHLDEIKHLTGGTAP